jgi:hypothetical protein
MKGICALSSTSRRSGRASLRVDRCTGLRGHQACVVGIVELVAATGGLDNPAETSVPDDIAIVRHKTDRQDLRPMSAQPADLAVPSPAMKRSPVAARQADQELTPRAVVARDDDPTEAAPIAAGVWPAVHQRTHGLSRGEAPFHGHRRPWFDRIGPQGMRLGLHASADRTPEGVGSTPECRR